MNSKPLSVGALCHVTIYSGGRVEVYTVRIIELWENVARVQILNAGIIRVWTDQLRVI